MAAGGFFSMYAGFGVSVVGIVAYRGPYFGVFDTLKEVRPSRRAPLGGGRAPLGGGPRAARRGARRGGAEPPGRGAPQAV